MSSFRFLAAQIEKIQPGTDSNRGQVNIPVVTNPDAVIASILTTVYVWAGIICVIVIIVGGYFYVTANANPQRIKRGKDAILYAVVGLVMIIMAFVITQFVLGRF